MFLFVFFFKQKTAYELRISDWSSDVCSSDLQLDAFVGHEPGDPAKLASVVLRAVDDENPPFHLLVGADGFESVQAKMDRLKADMDAWRAVSSDTAYARTVEIGRAAGRERVCKEGYMWVVGVELTKKKI